MKELLCQIPYLLIWALCYKMCIWFCFNLKNKKNCRKKYTEIKVILAQYRWINKFYFVCVSVCCYINILVIGLSLSLGLNQFIAYFVPALNFIFISLDFGSFVFLPEIIWYHFFLTIFHDFFFGKKKEKEIDYLLWVSNVVWQQMVYFFNLFQEFLFFIFLFLKRNFFHLFRTSFSETWTKENFLGQIGIWLSMGEKKTNFVNNKSN